MSEAELRERIADLTKQIGDAREYAFSCPDSELMSRLESDVAPLQRARRKLRQALIATAGAREVARDPRCTCATHNDGSKTTFLCAVHADSDPCATMASVTGRRRKGTIRRGTCTNCGHQS